MNAYALPVLLLVISNTFMTFAWYGHLGYKNKPLWLVVLVSWGIAFFEYMFQVPANRLGSEAGISTGKLKIIQEAITLAVFCVFSATWLGEKLTWNYYVGFGFVLVGVLFVYLGK
jgi:uncharacterized protein (DUF486 family)